MARVIAGMSWVGYRNFKRPFSRITNVSDDTVKQNASPDAVNVAASQVMAVHKVSIRVEALRVQIMAKVSEDVAYE